MMRCHCCSPGDVDDVVHTARDPVVPVLIPPTAVAREVIALRSQAVNENGIRERSIYTSSSFSRAITTAQ